MWSAPQRRLRRSRRHRRRSAIGVRFGDRCGRDDRSNNPASPSATYLSRHFRTVFASTWNRSAACSIVQPPSNDRRRSATRSTTPSLSLRSPRPIGRRSLHRRHRPARSPRHETVRPHVLGGPGPQVRPRDGSRQSTGRELRDLEFDRSAPRGRHDVPTLTSNCRESAPTIGIAATMCITLSHTPVATSSLALNEKMP